MSSVMMSTSVSKAMNAFSAEVIRACALKYGFDGEEAMRELSVSFAGPEGKKSKAKKETAPKAAARAIPSIPLPFTGVIREDCCLGVKQNHGLYTQCFSAPGETGLCKGCAKQASKNASGEPDCGLIAKRVMQGSEYRDAKGRAPVHYTKVMKKQKLTEEQVQAEAAKFEIEIDASHFAAPETKRGRPKKATTSDTESDASSSAADASGDKKKARGRPKKAAKVVEVNETEDLFASLMQQAQSASPRPSAGGGAAADEMSDVSSNSGSSDAEESDSESKVSKKKTKKSKEESEEELADKAAKFLAKEADKEKKAAAKAAEKEAEKQKKAAEKEAEKAKKLAEKEAEKAKKEAEKEAEKAKKLAEKEAAKAAKTAKTAKEEKPKKEKGSKKKAQAQQEKEPVKPVEPVADLEPESEEEEATSEAEEPTVTVKKFVHQGVTYLKSSDGVLYDAESQEVVGKWNETTKSIDVYDGESDEDSEESDDEDDE